MPDALEAISTGQHPAAESLRAAYPGSREHARAIPTLTWIAWQMRGARTVGWWEIPDWLGERPLRMPRIVASGLVVGLGFGLSTGLYSGSLALGSGTALMTLLATWFVSSRVRAGGLRRAAQPEAMVPRLPRSAGELLILGGALATGVLLRRTLIGMWRRPVADGPDSTYRACLRSTLIDGVACLLAGMPAIIASVLLGQPWLLLVAGALSGFAVVRALADGKVPAMWLASLYWPMRHARWVRFRGLLRDAAARGVLTPSGACYEFTDRAVQEYLAGRLQATLDERTQRAADRKAARRLRRAARSERWDEAVAAGTGGIRRRLLGRLTEPVRIRVAIDVGIGCCAAVLGWMIRDQFSSHPGSLDIAGAVFEVPLLAFGAGAISCVAVVFGLAWIADAVRWSLWLTGRMSPRHRVGWLAALVLAASLIALLAGPAGLRHWLAMVTLRVLPAVTVTVTGGWACVLADRRCQPARRRAIRLLPDALAAGATVVVVLLLLDRTLLGAQGAVGLLFPIAVWQSIVTWRKMNASTRVPVRAAADITASLLLGASAVGLLVWLANLLHMPPEEVSTLREAIDGAGKLLDVRWWIWASLYLALVAVGLMLALKPARLRRATSVLAKRVVPGTEILRRGSAGAHIALLLVALIGAAGPTAVGPVLRERLADKYIETLTDTAREQGSTAEFRQITAEIALLRAPLLSLADLILQIHRATKTPDGHHGASAIELDLADRLGRLQALTLAAAAAPPPVEQTEARAARDAGFDSPAGSASEEGKRLGELAEAEHDSNIAKEQAEQSGELAATTIAKTLQGIPGLGAGEVIGILKEFLSAVVEFSPLKDVFAAWVERLSGRTAPPAVTDVVVPDPARLKDAAAAQMKQEVAKSPVSDTLAVQDLLGEAGIAGAVDMVNQIRYLQENGTGPCDGCARPEPRDGTGFREEPIVEG